MDAEPRETVREVVIKIEKLRDTEKVKISMIKYSCS